MSRVKSIVKCFPFLLLAHIHFIYSDAGCVFLTPYFSIRSQGINSARQLAGWVEFINKYNVGHLYGAIYIAPEYTRSFNSNDITKCLFGSESNCDVISISGSRVPDRSPCDWLADYFYLPTDFQSTISVQPEIDNFLIDFGFYVGLDDWCPGMYFRFYAPFVHTRWNLHICENVIDKGVNDHCPGYFSPLKYPRGCLLYNFTQYVNGCIIEPLDQVITNTTLEIDQDFTVLANRLQYAKMSCTRLKKSRLADIRPAFGYNFCQTDYSHFGVNLQAAFPTGNRPKAKYLFEPIAGNGHHWELGLGLNGHYDFWQGCDEHSHALVYVNANITHLFDARQRRTYDLRDKPFSRYMLAEKMGTPIQYNLEGDGIVPSAQFLCEFNPVANLTTFCVDVSSSLQIDAAILAHYQRNGLGIDIGYNFWLRTCESIKLFGTLNELEKNTTWALKGDAQVYGFDRGPTGDDPLIGAVPLSATQRDATIFFGTNRICDRPIDQAKKNPGIDCPKNATGDVENSMDDHPLSAQPDINAITIQTSINPYFPQLRDVDFCQGKTKGHSHKIFAHISYTCWERERYIPSIGIGGEVEFGSQDTPKDCCAKCINCALSQWGIWLKGSIAFDCKGYQNNQCKDV